jgi:hypothetical protein
MTTETLAPIEAASAFDGVSGNTGDVPGSIVPRDPWEPITAEMWSALHARWPNGNLLACAWRIARDVDALHDLLLGRTVAPERLDKAEVESALEERHVQLVSPLDAHGFGWAA